MTQESSAPASTSAPAPGTPGGEGPPAVATTPRWLPILTSVLCVGLMVLLLVLILKERAPEEDAGDGQALPPHASDAGTLYGTPQRGSRLPPGALAACGDIDPLHPPRIELALEGGTVDLGTLKQGEKIVHEVTFRSVGEGPLCVVSAKSSCGCLKAALDGTEHVFAPGTEGTVRLAVDTTGRMGVINKRVTLTSNDPKTPLMSFRVKMDVSAGLMSDPQFLQFGNVPPSTAATRSLYLRSPKDQTGWKVTGVESIRKVEGMPPVTYTYDVEELPDERYRRVKVSIHHPGFENPGSYHDKLVVHTTHPERPDVQVSAHVHVVDRIVFRARTISLGFVRAGAPRGPTKARIEPGAPGVEFALTGVEILPPEGESFGPGGAPFVATYGKDGRGWWVEVRYDGKPRQAGLVEALLRVRTDDRAQPELRVPVRATVRADR